MNEQIQTLLARIPLMILLMLYGGYLGWGYYGFSNNSDSPLLQKIQNLQHIQQQTQGELEKLKKAQEFYETLEQRRAELRALALQLEEAKASLSEEIDVSSFVRMVVAEAKKVGMTVEEIKPTGTRKQEYYVEQSFDLKFRGVFVQLRVFMQRIAELNRIVRVGKLILKPSSPADSEYVLLEGNLELETFRYLGSHADELGKGETGSQATPGTGGSK